MPAYLPEPVADTAHAVLDRRAPALELAEDTVTVSDLDARPLVGDSQAHLVTLAQGAGSSTITGGGTTTAA